MSIPLCKACGKPGVNSCSGCGNAHYCSRDCQRLDWKSHKPTCKLTKDLAEKKDKVLTDALSRIPKFMEAISAIAYQHYDNRKNSVVICSFIETGTKEWACEVYLTQYSVTNVPDDHCPIKLSLAENIANNIDTQLSMAIPLGVCKHNCTDMFGTTKHKLPLKLNISQNRVIISDHTGRIIAMV